MVDESPYLPIVTITKSGTTKVASGFDPGAAEFNLIEARATLTEDGKSGIATLEILDKTGSLFSFFQPGGSVTIKMGKSAGSAQNILKGYIEMMDWKRPHKNRLTYILKAYDKSTILNRRLVNMHRFQKRLASGGLDSSDTSMDVGNLAKFVMGLAPSGATVNKDAYFPMTKYSNVKTIAQEHAISVAGVQLANQILPEYNDGFRYANDVLKDLGANLAWTHRIDETDVLKFASPSSVDSGLLFTDQEDAGSWPADKVGFIVDDSAEDGTITLEDTRNFLLGVGGNNDVETYYQKTTSGGQDTLYDLYRAYKLTGAGAGGAIKDVRTSSVAVWVDKVGTPTDDLFGEIRQDKNNSPTGASVKGFKIGRSDIKASGDSGDKWVQGDCLADINTQVDHWLILYRNPGDNASNHYRWFHDGGSGGTIATSSDGISWNATQTGTKAYAYLIFMDEQVVSMVQDASSINAYGQRDELVSDTTIKSATTMQNRLNGLLQALKNPKDIFSFASYVPDTLVSIGKTATIYNSLPLINNQKYKLIKADYVIKGIGALSLDITASKVYV